MRLEITRLYQIPLDNPKQTIGEAQVINDKGEVVKTFHTLELPWLDNKVRKSCIDTGEYKCRVRNSAKYGKHFHVQEVEGRTLILLHSGSFYYHTLGCVLPGSKLKDVNNDGLEDVIGSRDTMEWLRDNMPDEFELKVKWRT